jgi:hypothetical protein
MSAEKRDPPSIWGCVETDAISRDFDYDNYLSFHTRIGCKAQPVSKSGYAMLSAWFHHEMEEDMKSGNWQCDPFPAEVPAGGVLPELQTPQAGSDESFVVDLRNTGGEVQACHT